MDTDIDNISMAERMVNNLGSAKRQFKTGINKYIEYLTYNAI